MRRAQKAADAGMAAAAAMIAAARVDGDRAVLEGEPLTSERLKRRIEAAPSTASSSPPRSGSRSISSSRR